MLLVGLLGRWGIRSVFSCLLLLLLIFFSLANHSRYTEEPTEAEVAEMERLIEGAEEGTETGAHDDDIEAIKTEASKLEWSLEGKQGLKKALAGLLKVLQAHPNKLDLPDDEKEARLKLGQIMTMHRDKTAEEMVLLVVKEIGFHADKVAKAAKKEEAVESVCKNPKNASIVAALQELSELYAKEGSWTSVMRLNEKGTCFFRC